MPKFQKKPVVIDAFQMTAEHRESNADWPEWLNKAWQKEFTEVGSFYPLASALFINTLEGQMSVRLNDWIIRGVAGELYACKPDIFDQTYQAI